jgi:tRNA pseudouridine55 synthase
VTGPAGGERPSQGGQSRPAQGKGQRGGTGRWAGGGGLVIVDKPQGLTSHDVVARIRRLAGTRRVGHAGTLDPMATGVLVIGVEKATRLLGHLALGDKEYSATIRLGQATDTDDAEGQVTAEASAAAVTQEALGAAVATLTGQIEQVPPGYSAIKVAGKRAYRLAREGAAPELAARSVTVTEFTVLAVRHDGDLTDADVTVTCSSGTYIRALARDLGRELGVGGHLTALRRTRVGPFEIATAATLDQLSASFTVTPLAEAARVAFRPVELTEDQARAVAHGVRLAIEDLGWPGDAQGPIAAFAPDGSLIALLTGEAGQARPLAVFAG